MSADSSFLLNRVFTRNTFRQVLDNGSDGAYVTAIRRYVVDPDGKNNGQLISEIYQVLRREYRNEYYYKNTILNELLLKAHDPTETTALTEVTIGRSKADFVLINGTATAYEIKTELDNFDRLESQIADYSKAFTRVSVLTCEHRLVALQKRLSASPVGVWIMTENGTIAEVKKPQECSAGLDAATMFRVLRKQEFEKIIGRHFGSLPAVTQYEYYSACKRLFCQLDTPTAFSEFVATLKKRARIDIEAYQKVPYELKFLVYFSNFRARDYQKLDAFLRQEEADACTSPTYEVGSTSS